MKLSVFIIEGDFREFDDPSVGYMKFCDLTFDEAATLLTFAFRQGFQVVCIPENSGKDGAD